MADTSWELTGNSGTNPGTNPGQNFLGTSDNEPLVIATNGTQRASMDTSGNFALSGNVGIGTSAPRSLLEVQASVSGKTGSIVTLTNSAADAQGSAAAMDLNTFPPPATSTTIGTVGHPGTLVQYNPSARILAQSAGNFEADVSISCNRPGAANNGLMEKVLITPGGVTAFGTLNVLPTPQISNVGNAGVAYAAPNMSVGIGTASPRSVVEVSVQAPPGQIGPSLTLTNPAGGQGAAASIDFNTYNPPAADYNPSARIEAQDDGNYGNNILFSDNTPGAANNGPAERMRITSTGFVGIGTTTPHSVLKASVQNPGNLGPSLTLTNPAGGQGAAASIDFNTYNNSPAANYSPTARIEAVDDGNYGNSIFFWANNPGAPPGTPDYGPHLYMVIYSTGQVVVGDLKVDGTLTKAGGGFHIDHPLDPQNKYLNHSFVESSDMKNLYDGIAVLDDNGQATVTLPDWFDTLNEDFRYQLTPIGAPAPQLHLADEIAKRTLRIAGGSPRQRISWQVTGSRKDPWARTNPLSVEEAKAAVERGHYLHPQLFGADRALSIMAARFPKSARRGAAR
jgi:hypothetical protein